VTAVAVAPLYCVSGRHKTGPSSITIIPIHTRGFTPHLYTH